VRAELLRAAAKHHNEINVTNIVNKRKKKTSAESSNSQKLEVMF
jgi:hypothetical protein